MMMMMMTTTSGCLLLHNVIHFYCKLLYKYILTFWHFIVE